MQPSNASRFSIECEREGEKESAYFGMPPGACFEAMAGALYFQILLLSNPLEATCLGFLSTDSLWSKYNCVLEIET